MQWALVEEGWNYLLDPEEKVHLFRLREDIGERNEVEAMRRPGWHGRRK